MDKDRRRHVRFSVHDVRGKLVSSSSVSILNLSLGGVALKADKRLNIGSPYNLRLEVGGKSVVVQGVVVWCILSGIRPEEGQEGVAEYSAGLRFTDVLSEKMEELLSFIDEYKVVPEQRLVGVRFAIEGRGKALIDYPESYRVKLLSLSGMLIESERGFDVETVHPMELMLPHLPPLRFTGRIATLFEVREPTPAHYEMGVEFLEMSDEARARLEGYVAGLARTRAGRLSD
jgi:hypothetical protein